MRWLQPRERRKKPAESGRGTKLAACLLGQQHDPDLVHQGRQSPQNGLWGAKTRIRVLTGTPYHPPMLFLLSLVVRVLARLLALSATDEATKDLEILVLQQQLRVLRRQAGRPRFTALDRVLLAAASRALPRRQWTSLFLVTPKTLLRWHHDLVRRKWTYRNKRQPGRPPIDSEIVALVLRMALRGQGEPALGLRVGARKSAIGSELRVRQGSLWPTCSVDSARTALSDLSDDGMAGAKLDGEERGVARVAARTRGAPPTRSQLRDRPPRHCQIAVTILSAARLRPSVATFGEAPALS